jgi:two-component system, NarL family, sensor histidine kinase EvgS
MSTFLSSLLPQRSTTAVSPLADTKRLQARIAALEEERRSLFSLSDAQFTGMALKLSCDLQAGGVVGALQLDHASEHTTHWLGVSPAASAEQPLRLLEALGPADARRLQRRWLVSRKKRQPFSQLVGVKLRQGQRWLHVQVMPARRGERLVWECLGVDVTALQQARQAEERRHHEQMTLMSALNARLRTPLNAIAGNVQLLQQRNASSELQAMGHGCQELTQILDEVLDTAALASGSVQLSEDEIDLGVWLQELVPGWRHQAADRALEFFLSLDNCDHRVQADRKRLGQVLGRLFLTSIATARPGEIRLGVQCQHQGARLHVTVTLTVVGDKAAGAAAAAQVALAPAHAGPALTSPLGWAQEMARRMGGSVGSSVDSPDSHTLRLRISLPLLAERATPALQSTQPLNILVVDDSMTNRIILKRFLQSQGHVVTEADNGRFAVEAVRRDAPDLVFMDIDMPEMDGCQASQQIRTLAGAAAQVRICAMTGLSFDQDRERAMAHGMDHFIAKPVNFKEVQAICAVISRPRLRPDVGAPANA